MILTVTVNPALDKNYIVPGFTVSGIHRVETMTNVPAGKGINVARVLHSLGIPSIATGFLGGHTGKQIAAGLKEGLVAHDFVWIKEESRCSTLIFDPNHGVHSEVIEPGPKIPPGAWKRLNRKLKELAPHCKWIVFSGSPPPETPTDAYYKLIKEVQTFGVKVVLDTRGPWLRDGIKAGPNLIKPNWDEFQELVGTCDSIPHAMDKGRNLLAQGIETVVVSMGAQGAFAVQRDQAYVVQKLPPIELVSAVGSGDSLVAGILAKLWMDQELADALRFGLAVASSNATHFGAGIFQPKQVEQLEHAISIEKITF